VAGLGVVTRLMMHVVPALNVNGGMGNTKKLHSWVRRTRRYGARTRSVSKCAMR